MPVQKGKRRKRPRRRGAVGTQTVDQANYASASTTTKNAARPVRRKRFESPLWLNILIGTALVILGVLFSVFKQKGLGTTEHAIILIGYFALAGLYFAKAFRQYRSKREST